MYIYDFFVIYVLIYNSLRKKQSDCLYCFYFPAVASDTSEYLLQIMITIPDPQLLFGLNESNVSLEFNNSIVVIDSQVTTGNTNVLLLYKSRHV